MNRFLHEMAMMAALLVLVAGIWQDWGTLATLKKMLISYLGFFGLGAGMTLAVRSARLRRGTAHRSQTGRRTITTDA